MKKVLFLIFSVVLLNSCSEKAQEKEYEVAEVPTAPKIIDLYSPQIDSMYALMSDEERIYQLFWVDAKFEKEVKTFEALPPVAFYHHNIQEQTKLQPDSSVLPIGYFIDDPNAPFLNQGNKFEFSQEDLLTIADSNFLQEFQKRSLDYFQEHRIAALLMSAKPPEDTIFLQDWKQTMTARLDTLYAHKILLGDGYDSENLESIRTTLQQNIGVTLDHDSLMETSDSVCKLNLISLSWNDSLQEQFIQEVLLGNYDAAKISWCRFEEVKVFKDMISSILDKKLINKELLEYKVRKSIALKLWTQQLFTESTTNPNVTNTWIKGLIYKSKYQSLTVLNNQKNLLPLGDLPKKQWKYVVLGDSKTQSFSTGIGYYAKIASSNQKLKGLTLGSGTDPQIIILNNLVLDSIQAKGFVQTVKTHAKNHKIVVINCGNPSNLKFLKEVPVLVQSWVADEAHLSMLAQAIVGGNPIYGKTITPYSGWVIAKTAKTRLAYSIPEEVGISADSIKKIDKIAAEAIWGGATPGCQVFVAKEGKVIFNKGFGYHTYLHEVPVTKETVYDIASVTKVASTTLCGMHMYDKGYYKIQDSLKLHLPDSLTKVLGHFSRLYNVNFFRLFTHTSGLPDGLPIYKYMSYVNEKTGRFDKYFCDEPNQYFKVEVAKGYYLDSAYLDSLWIATNNIWTGTKEYNYSDANMNVLYQIFRSKLTKSQRFEKYMDSVFYAPLGLETTCFLPLKNLDTIKHKIAPTENDKYWRKQIIKGYAHDPNAALYGGVAGNAGLFSTAHDLGIIMQMLENGGSYGGRQYIQSSTVKKFSVHQEGSHRGLGFDKPTASSGNVVAPDCPYTAYGHTGFTGICVWNDPENDLVFTFTSNRVHPSAENKKLITLGIRKRLHQVIYDQLYYNGSYKNAATKNIPVTRQNQESPKV